jgi:hypothetical protein
VDSVAHPGPGTGYVGLAVLVLIVVGIAAAVWKPAIALMIAGALSIIGGIFAGGLIGLSVGISTIIGGIVLVGLGRMLEVAEKVEAHLRGLRRDLKESRPARKADPTG